MNTRAPSRHRGRNPMIALRWVAQIPQFEQFTALLRQAGQIATVRPSGSWTALVWLG